MTTSEAEGCAAGKTRPGRRRCAHGVNLRCFPEINFIAASLVYRFPTSYGGNTLKCTPIQSVLWGLGARAPAICKWMMAACEGAEREKNARGAPALVVERWRRRGEISCVCECVLSLMPRGARSPGIFQLQFYLALLVRSTGDLSSLKHSSLQSKWGSRNFEVIFIKIFKI